MVKANRDCCDGATETYFVRAALYLGHFSNVAPVGLFLVKLQILQPLGQGQFLLDGHAEERVQCLFLILCCSQLPLHLIQLDNIFITSSYREYKQRRKKQNFSGTFL